MKKLYHIRDEYQWKLEEEAGSTDADFNYGYSFNGGVNEGINEVPKETVIMGEKTVSYSIRNIRGKPRILLSHSFEQLDEMLESE